MTRAAAALLLAGAAFAACSDGLTHVTLPVTAPTTVITNPGMGWMMEEFLNQGGPDVQTHCRGTDTVPPRNRFPLVAATEVIAAWSAVDRDPLAPPDFSAVDEVVDYWSRTFGRRVSLRLTTEDIGCYDPFCARVAGYKTGFRGVPEWLYAKMAGPVECTDEGTTSGAIQCRVDDGTVFQMPDYTWSDGTTSYRAALERVVRAYGARYQDHPAVELVQLHGYGLWGEWHSGHDLADLSTRQQVLGDLLALWGDAWAGKKPLVLSASYEYRRGILAPGIPYQFDATDISDAEYQAFRSFSGFDRAWAMPAVSFRRDGFDAYGAPFFAPGAPAAKVPTVNPALDGRMLREYFGRTDAVPGPLVAEFKSSYAGFQSAGVRSDGISYVDLAICEALAYHVNYIMMPGYACGDGGPENAFGWDADNPALDADRFYEERGDLVARGLQAEGMGYRLELPEVAYSPVIDDVTPLTVVTVWQNRAVGRATRAWPLTFFLVDNQETVVWSGADPAVDVRTFARGNDATPPRCGAAPADEPVRHRVQSSLRPTVPPGSYSLRLALVGEDGAPAVRLATDAPRDGAGRIVIGTVRRR